MKFCFPLSNDFCPPETFHSTLNFIFELKTNSNKVFNVWIRESNYFGFDFYTYSEFNTGFFSVNFGVKYKSLKCVTVSAGGDTFFVSSLTHIEERRV